MYMKYCCLLGLLWVAGCTQNKEMNTAHLYAEPYRPQVHFSPKKNWMNDPNGMVYLNNVWHLFFQYYPDSTVWGPMHWGHATSKDLVHWTEQPVALYPDSIGYIFSGSIVADLTNSSHFGKDGQAPLVALFTQHDPKGEKQGGVDFQNQSIAYSVDEGKTWTKYSMNPVLKNPGIKDFRDPKIMWYEKGKIWIMTLATKDRVSFYTSTDLTQWSKASEFGESLGAHGGVWECPDLFSMDDQGKTVWVLLVSINPGGPQGGSATQYFTGDFDGTRFTTSQTETKWIDQGTDNYAGITWSNTGSRKVFLGWMSNWQYAQAVPTVQWRSAMTIPRELTIEQINGAYYLQSFPVKELAAIEEKGITENNLIRADKKLRGPAKLHFVLRAIDNFSVTLSNTKGEKWIAGYDKNTNQYFIDRTASGKINFEKGFAGKIFSKRISTHGAMDITLLIDDASVEFFADKGTNTLTSIFFPNEKYSAVKIEGGNQCRIDSLALTPLKSIWIKNQSSEK